MVWLFSQGHSQRVTGKQTICHYLHSAPLTSKFDPFTQISSSSWLDLSLQSVPSCLGEHPVTELSQWGQAHPSGASPSCMIGPQAEEAEKGGGWPSSPLGLEASVVIGWSLLHGAGHGG